MTEEEYLKERDAILEVHRRYMVANGKLDAVELQNLWSHEPSNVFFNLTGHVYRGLEQWTKLWNYYSTRMELVIPWMSWDHNVTIRGDVAWLTCLRVSQQRWAGNESAPMDNIEPMISRATEIYEKEDDGTWRVVHAHFSKVATTPRPGNV